MCSSEFFGEAIEMIENKFSFAKRRSLELAHDYLALEHGRHGLAKLVVLIEQLGEFRPGLGADDRMRGFVCSQKAEEILRLGVGFHSPQQARFEEVCFEIIGELAHAFVYERQSFIESMAAVVENGEFEKGVRNFLRHGERFFEAMHRLVGPKNHAIRLTGQVEDIGTVAGDGE